MLPIHGSIGMRGLARFVIFVSECLLPYPTEVVPVFLCAPGQRTGIRINKKDNK